MPRVSIAQERPAHEHAHATCCANIGLIFRLVPVPRERSPSDGSTVLLWVVYKSLSKAKHKYPRDRTEVLRREFCVLQWSF